MNMNDMILKLIMSFLTDDNLRKMILPVKHDLLAKLEANAAATPEFYDDVLVKVLKIVFEG